jgi:hypothetical protein
LGAFLSVGSVLAYLHNNELRLQNFCGTPYPRQPICALTAAGYYELIYAAIVVGVGLTVVGFYLGSRYTREQRN